MKKILLFVFIAAPIGLFAQAFQLNLQGTRQIGRGSTGLAEPTDATSLFTNPGSAAFVDSNDVAVGFTPIFSSGTFTDAESNAVDSIKNGLSTPFNISLMFGKNGGKLKYGLSVYTPFGSALEWKQGSTVRFVVSKISLLSVAFQPTASYKVTDKLGIGVGLIYTYGKVKIGQDLPVQFEDGTFGSTEIDANANGYGINMGIYYQLSDKLAFAATYRSRMNMKTTATGKVTFDVPQSVEYQFPNQKISATLPLPQIFGVGVTYKPAKHFLVNVEGYLSDWSKYDTIRVKFKEKPVASQTESDMIRDYKTGYTLRIGVEYNPDKKYELRAGAICYKSPIQDGYVSPDVPGANRISPSVGGSYIISNKLRIDAAFLAEFIRRSDKNVVSDLNGTYQFDLFIPSIGLTYKY